MFYIYHLYTVCIVIWFQKVYFGDFHDGPVVKTPRFHCRVRGFDPWLGN